MADRNGAREGGCRCDGVRFLLSAAPLIAMACHCTGCQRMTGSAFSLTIAVPSSSFSVTKGEPVIGGLHGPTRHYFCGYCMSWLFTRPEGFDAFVNVRATMLDDSHDFVPFVETMTSEKLPWATTPAVHSFAKFPPVDRYQELAEQYAALVRKAGAGGDKW
jgi:hypothetical protein